MRSEKIDLPRRISSTAQLRQIIYELTIEADRIEKKNEMDSTDYQICLSWGKMYSKDRTCKECGNVINVWEPDMFAERRDEIASEWVHDGISYIELLLRYPITRRRLTIYLDKLGVQSRNKIDKLKLSPKRRKS